MLVGSDLQINGTRLVFLINSEDTNMLAIDQSLNTAPSATVTPFDALKSKQQKMWDSGDYAVIGTSLQIVGESLCEAADVCAGESILDVAAGNGNATLAAARRFANVTSTDYVPTLLEKARQRATAEGLTVDFRTADAEALEFDDDSFDASLSTFGVMFTPNQERAAAELVRVTRPGGRIGLANWTPEGFIGRLFKTVGKHVSPPAGVKPPALWGTESRISELFGSGAVDITINRKQFNFRYRSAEHFMTVFRTYYGPVHKAFATLDAQGKNDLHADFIELLNDSNQCRKGTLVIPGEYLEIVITIA